MKRSTPLLTGGVLVALAIIAGAWSYLAQFPPAAAVRLTFPQRVAEAIAPPGAAAPAAPSEPTAPLGVEGAPNSPADSRRVAVTPQTRAPSGAPTTSAPSALASAPVDPAPADQGGNDERTGYIAPASVPFLRARAVSAEIIQEEQPPDAKEAATLAAQQFTEGARARAAADATALDSLAGALRSKSGAEDKADLLALLSDTSDRTGARVRQLIMDALRPSQPLVVQRQALYLATQYNIGIVKALAGRAGHPLQQDAEAFLIEHDRELGVRPEPVDEPDPLPPPQ